MRTPKTRLGREPRQAGRASIPEQIRAARAERDTCYTVITLYQMHYRSLVRLAALLVADLDTAEDIVQDSFAAVHGTWPALPDTDTALCYLRRSVVRRSRSASRRRRAAGTGAPDQGSAIVSALRALPARQREVLVLRYFADLPEAEIASVTGMSAAAVKSRTVRAMSSLRAELRTTDG